MRYLTVFLIIIFFQSFMLFPNGAAAEPAGKGNVRKYIEKANAAHMKEFNQRRVDDIVKIYTEDATILPPGKKLVKGLKDIRKYWETSLSKELMITDLKTVDVEMSGDLAYEIGNFHLKIQPEEPEAQDTPLVSEGHYLTVWKRQADGGWKIQASISVASSKINPHNYKRYLKKKT